MAENSLLDIDSFENTLKPEDKVRLRRKTKDATMSLYKDGLSNSLLVSTMNESEFADIIEFVILSVVVMK